jgi:hypothetical protein
VRLKAPYVFNSFRFLVEVRVRNGRLTMPGCVDDVRVRGPICPVCGVPLARVETRPECERYACRQGIGHGELWVGRTSHLCFSEFMQEQLSPMAYHALRRHSLPLEPASMGAALNLSPC